ncbi:MAG: peptidoglycan DD-metalloendopeptidase family protein [Ruminiclostridium sp.]|nr:peptidoglycan DD-metalloendopeptidase family protein [Ruminiclostridium sp.]
MKQKRTQQRGDFIEGKGFYIILFLCVAAIGISGYYLFQGLTGPAGGFGPESAVSGQAEIRQEEPAPIQTEPPAQETTEPQTEPTAPEPKEEVPEDAPTSTAYVWPVQGEVQRDFSLEVFAYDDTMGDWRTHAGLDIAAPAGTTVCASGKGTVTSVSLDPMLGQTVTVDHGTGMQTFYANLSETVNVQVGDEVVAGTVLGTVGTTAISESASPDHLHFEMIEYDVSIDPMHYLH